VRSITVTMWVTLDGVVQGLGRADEDTRDGFTHGGWGPRYDDGMLVVSPGRPPFTSSSRCACCVC
jgi:hypothetical protein